MVATSSNHAEILALHDAEQECSWFRSTINHINDSCRIKSIIDKPTVLYEDNTACIAQSRQDSSLLRSWSMVSECGDCIRSQGERLRQGEQSRRDSDNMRVVLFSLSAVFFPWGFYWQGFDEATYTRPKPIRDIGLYSFLAHLFPKGFCVRRF